MSFQSPWRLLLIVAPVALLVAYLIAQKMRQKYAMRFTSVDLLKSVAPKRPGWQRHISAALMLFAVLALVVGFARPEKTVKVPKQRGTVLLAIDTSGSMAADDVAPTRLAAAQSAAKLFVSKLPPGLKIGLLGFDSSARLLVTPTPDRPTVTTAIDSLRLGGGTATGDAITQSLAAIKALPPEANGKPAAAAIVLMSDGTPTIGHSGSSPEEAVTAAVAAAKDAKVPINTIAFGTPNGTVTSQGEVVPVPADPQAMEDIAKGANGKSFTATTAGQLNSVYDQIRRSVGYDSVQRDVTAWFTGLGLLLAILTAGAALFWMQRIP